MGPDIEPQDIPVVLLYNIEPDWNPQEAREARDATLQLGAALEAVGHPVVPVPLMSPDLAPVLDAFDPARYVVLNWCESLPGIPFSEPQVARELEALGYVYTGADAAALTLSQDKCAMKTALTEQGIDTPVWRLYHQPRLEGWDRFPAMVKAAYEHGSEGITRDSVAMDADALRAQINQVLTRQHQPGLVEDFIDGREFHVSLWGNGHIEMLPPAEMDFSGFEEVKDRLCSYEAKFIPGSPHYDGIQTLLPAPLKSAELNLIESACRLAYAAVGCRDYGRIDLRMKDEICYVLDVNPNPDISADASMTSAAELTGLSYGEMGSALVRLAAHRHPGLGSGLSPAS